GSYLDAASGNSFTNYLYLNNDYVLSGSTNVALINGIPDNLFFQEFSTRQPTGVLRTPSGAFTFPAGAVTNYYSYGNAQLITTTGGTNIVATSALTNMPGRIE